jgi:DDE family transposase
MVQTLRDVWRTHYARDDGKPRWRGIAELPAVAERMQSPYDPEAHFSMKRHLSWTGYKVHVTETCDDDAAHLITHVKTCPSMRPDMTSTAEIHDRLAAKGLLPAEHFVDSGYVDAELLASSRRDHGVSLEGPVRGVSSRVGEGHELRHFSIDWDREQVICPQGKTSVSWRRIRAADGSPRIHAQFSRGDCGVCSAKAACTPKTSARRYVHFHLREEYEALNAARARMSDPAWLERYRRRAGVEGTLSQGVRAFGMRRSRYIGLAKTGLQQVCTAVAMNVSRVVHWLNGRPRAKTRVTRFAALASAA